MITCITQNEEGKRIFEILIAQYNKVNTDGVTYRLNRKTITEKHFDFENTIIKELQTQGDSRNAPGKKNWREQWNAIYNQWREGVGGAQKRLPMHIVDEYCFNEPFYPVPKFTSQPKSSKQFYNGATHKDENWFSVDSKLSVSFAIYKGGMGGGVQVGAVRQGRGGGRDLVAMTALCKVRTNDFIDLKSQLEDQMTLDNHHQVSEINSVSSVVDTTVMDSNIINDTIIVPTLSTSTNQISNPDTITTNCPNDLCEGPRAQLINLLNNYYRLRQADEREFKCNFFKRFQFSRHEKVTAVDALIAVLQPNDATSDLPQHLPALRQGTLGYTIRTFIKEQSDQAAKIVGKKVDTVSDFITALSNNLLSRGLKN